MKNSTYMNKYLVLLVIMVSWVITGFQGCQSAQSGNDNVTKAKEFTAPLGSKYIKGGDKFPNTNSYFTVAKARSGSGAIIFMTVFDKRDVDVNDVSRLHTQLAKEVNKITYMDALIQFNEGFTKEFTDKTFSKLDSWSFLVSRKHLDMLGWNTPLNQNGDVIPHEEFMNIAY